MTFVLSPIKSLTTSLSPTKTNFPSFIAKACALQFKLSTVKIYPFLKTKSADFESVDVQLYTSATIERKSNMRKAGFINI
jgi:hypothetical protein